MKKPLLKVFKIAGLCICGMLILLFLIPALFPGKVVEKLKGWANESLNGELDFSRAGLSFFNHFPSLTVTLYDVSLKGSAPFKKDTLVAADEIALGINVGSLIFGRQIHIDKIFLSDARISVLVNEAGEANYNVYAATDKKANTTSDSAVASLRLEKISISNTRVTYSDRSLKLLLDARGFNYTGSGDLDKSLFDLESRARIDSISFSLGEEAYLIDKQIKANLVTRINTDAFSLIFRKNRLKINQLSLGFKGQVDFLENGYGLDLEMSALNSSLHDLITAFPPQYVNWLNKTKVKGITDLMIAMKGKYIASAHTFPDLDAKIKIRDGYVKHADAPFPAADIYLDLKANMPATNPDSLKLNLDSVFFHIDRGYFAGHLNAIGVARPQISTVLKAQIDLGKLDEAFGFSTLDCKGKIDLNLRANGRYDLLNKRFPVTDADIRISDANIKTAYYPHPIANINMQAAIKNTLGDLSSLNVKVDPFSFQFEEKPFFVRAFLKDFDHIVYDMEMKGEIDVAKIYEVFACKDLALKGYIDADLKLQGSAADVAERRYERLNNKGELKLKDISINSAYFPLPFVIREGAFRFDQDKMSFDDFSGAYGQSDLKMNGYLQHVIDYVFSSGGVLKGQFSVHADHLNVNEFMSSTSVDSSGKTASGGVALIPPLYDLSLKASAGNVLFKDLHLQNLATNVSVNKGKLSLKETGFDIIGCKVRMDMEYANEGSSKALFDYRIRADNFDIRKAYDTIKIFRELVSAAANAEGIVSVDYSLKGTLDSSMSPVYPSLTGSGTLSLQDVKVKGLKMFSAISRKIANDSINNPNLRKVNIRSRIKNNVITVDRFRFKVFGFRPRIEGQTSLDGRLNLKMRLGLPPLGIIGIPITVTGSSDDPVVRLGKKNSEEIEETEYIEE